jgi:hypothetical protein
MEFYVIKNKKGLIKTVLDKAAARFVSPFNTNIYEHSIDQDKAISYIDNPDVLTIGLVIEEDETFNNYSSVMDYNVIMIINGED